MTKTTFQRASEDQVFLMMGVSELTESSECAIVMAADLEAAKRAFEGAFKGFLAMTWPSLREIRMSVDMLETARDGGFPDDLVVINAIQAVAQGGR